MDKIRTLYHKKYFILFSLCLCVSAVKLQAQTVAPGGPGKDAYWATAAKQGIGTSASPESTVWFTLADGVMTEVYYPNVTVANVHLLQFLVKDQKTYQSWTERDDSIHKVKVLRPDSLSFQQINTSRNGDWSIVKTYTTDPVTNSVLIDVRFKANRKHLALYVYYDPSLANTGMHDTADRYASYLTAFDGNIASALLFSSSPRGVSLISEESNGFLGVNDGLTLSHGRLSISSGFEKAENGNVVQTAMRIQPDHFTVALAFGNDQKAAVNNAIKSLNKGFIRTQQEYDQGWADFVRTLPKVDPKYQAQFNMAAMVLKAQEDKTVRGANVASLTIPWGGGANANEDVGGGYHLVWARDLYEVFTAYMALGDKAAANRALDFLFNIQQKPDGSFPQNSWLDGRNGWGGLQMDEVGYPLIMAWQLSRFDKQTYEKHVKPAADFIVSHGPTTPQERWEEKGGYSPSTIAAEIAGLVCAADIAKRNGDEPSARYYLVAADEWQTNIEKWTATTNGPYGDGHYYLRLTQGHPDAGEKIELNNGAGIFKENEIVDAGFLELVRLGIKPADDPLIAKSVKVIDQQIKVDTPNGPAFYRYSHDGYGEMEDGRRWNFDGKYTGKGRPWPLLSGERGQYELAECGISAKEFPAKTQRRKEEKTRTVASVPSSINPQCISSVRFRLDNMLAFANDGLMIPEQVWDKKEVPVNRDREFVPELKFGEGTGSATPLAWSMAQFIRLAMNLKAEKNLDTPQVVYDRYVRDKLGDFIGDPATSIESAIDPNKILALPVQDQTDAKLRLPLLYKTSPQFVDCSNTFVIPCKDPTNQMHACFNFEGAFKTSEIAGDFTGWKPQTLHVSENGGKVLMQCFTFSKKARVEYKLVVDGKWITDPLNPNKIDNGVGGENSVFTMPDYKPTEWDKGSISGKIETLEIVSKVLNDTRKVQVYVPQVQGNVQQSLRIANPIYPVMYVLDGSDYIKRAKAIEIQENLVKAYKVRSFIMVFLDPKDRNKEYWANDDFAKYLGEEVVPAVDKQYRTYPYPEFRGVMGASLGGVTSIWTAIKYPDVFGRVGGQSSSFWIDDERVVKELGKLDFLKTKLKFYLDTGTLEGTANTEKVVKILRDEHYDVVYYTSEAGHNWTAWRDRLSEAFIAIFGNKILPR